MHPLFENDLFLSRRHFFGNTGLRLGGLGLIARRRRAASTSRVKRWADV